MLLAKKLKAATIHFSATVVVVTAIAALIYLVWYPEPTATVIDAFGLIKIAAAVDIILGPLLTAVVYKPGKPSLKFDLSVIVLAQAIALGYALYSIAIVRPVFIATTPDRLQVVSAFEVSEDELAKGPAEYQNLPWFGPIYVGTRKVEQEEFLETLDMAQRGNDVYTRPSFFIPYEAAWEQLKTKCIDRDGQCEMVVQYRRKAFKALVDNDGKLVHAKPTAVID